MVALVWSNLSRRIALSRGWFLVLFDIFDWLLRDVTFNQLQGSPKRGFVERKKKNTSHLVWEHGKLPTSTRVFFTKPSKITKFDYVLSPSRNAHVKNRELKSWSAKLWRNTSRQGCRHFRSCVRGMHVYVYV